MNHKAVCIHHFGRTAYAAKAKTILPFLDVVLHFAPPAIEPDHLVRSQLHCGDKERIQVDHLTVRFLNLEDNPAGMAPGSCLIQEFSVFNRIIHLIVFRCAVQRLVFLLRQLAEDGIFFQADGIFTVLVFKDLIQIRRSKPAVTPEIKRHTWEVTDEFIQE